MPLIRVAAWVSAANIPARSYACGYCQQGVASALGMYENLPDLTQRFAYICPMCGNVTQFSGQDQTPAPPFGNPVTHLPPEVDHLYKEARDCMPVAAYTSSVLASRKLLMNMAVTKGDTAGKSFQAYITYLEDNHYMPPGSHTWVDHIRKKGNEATHEIPQMSRADAEELLSFVEMLLKFIYEYPARVAPLPAPGQATP